MAPYEPKIETVEGMRLVDDPQGGRLSIQYHPGDGSVGCFLILWLPLWIYGTVRIAMDVWPHPTARGVGVLALMGGIALLMTGFMLWGLFGREILVVDSGELDRQVWTLIRLRRRPVNVLNVKAIDVVDRPARRQQNGHGLSIRLPADQILFGRGLTEQGAAYLKAAIERHLRRIKVTGIPEPTPPSNPPGPMPVEQEIDPYEGVPGPLRGILSGITQILLMGVAIAWNLGIIGVLVQSIRAGRIGTLLILIPFLIIGLFLALMALMILWYWIRRTVKGIGWLTRRL